MIGTKLAHYEITGHLGSGGMGDVYQATDSKLGRNVAVKLLPEAFARDSDRVARFEREARVLASLNHPNIAAIYGFEKSEALDCLVMELVPGETLAQRIKRGAIPLDEALGIAKQIAEALEAAHEQNIVHRDLKPANVKITPDGKVKVLDFGLAKAYEQEQANPNLSNSPTMASMGGTNAGVILGTAAYMSPEQAKGRNVDKRTDIFAFGCVLYEMLTGRRAFDGDDVTDILGAVLRMEPDWTQLPSGLPPAVQRLLRLSLEKNVRNRRSAATDVRLDIEQALKEPQSASTSVVAPAPTSRLPWVVAAVFVSATVVLGVLLTLAYRAATEPSMVSFSVQAPEKTVFQAGTGATNFGAAASAGTISPNGQMIAFTALDGSGRELLWMRPLASLTSQPFSGTEGAVLPFWSADSRAIGFFANRKLKRVDIAGGEPQVVCDAPDPVGGAWGPDGTIVFAPEGNKGLFRVNSAGGEATSVLKPSSSLPGLFYPSFLPDGRHFIFLVGDSSKSTETYAGSLDSNESKRLLSANSVARYSPPGELLYVRQGTLFAQPFDAAKLQISGDPVRIAESLPVDFGYSAFSASANGILTYRTGAVAQTALQLGWFDRNGKLLESVGVPGGYAGPDVSPDGKRIAVHRHDTNGGDIWIFESASGPMPRFTFDAAQENSNALWSPNGKEIAFASLRNGKWGLYRKPSNLTGSEELLVESDIPKYPTSWSPDGKYLVYGVIDPKTGQDIWLLPLTGDRKATPLMNSQFIERDGQISPDGKWLAYASDETGEREVYVRPFPSGDGKHQISTNGGTYPRWRRDGKELFYYISVLDTKVMSVTLSISGSTFEASAPRELFDSKTVAQVPGHALNWVPYAVSPDGQRFLFPRAASNLAGDVGPNPITVILNWTALLKKK